MSSTIFERAPSAPTRYFARTAYSRPESRSRSATVTPSASCSCDRYSVFIAIDAPRKAASLTSTGSMKVCGMSSMGHGLCCR